MKLPNQYPYSESQLIRDNPNVSFPSDLSNVDLSQFGVVKVELGTMPDYDPDTQRVIELTPFPSGNKYHQNFGIADLTEEQRRARIPHVVSMRQAKLALHEAGLLDTVNAAMQQADRKSQIEWEYAQEVRRDWPTLILMQASLNLTDEKIDQLFAAASLL